MARRKVTHVFSSWWQCWVSIGVILFRVVHPHLLSSWFTRLAFVAGWKPKKQAGQSIPRSLLRHLRSFPGSRRAANIRSAPARRTASRAGRRQSRFLPPLPFPQQMQECFDVLSLRPERPVPALTTSQTPPPPPYKSPKLRQAPRSGMPASPSCRMRVKNSFSPCTCSIRSQDCGLFLQPRFPDGRFLS